MKIAHIVPRNHLDLADLGDFYFALAHIALRDEAYREHFTARGSDVYLDNGVWETGTPVDTKTMIELASEMQPDYVYATDYIDDSARTIQAVQEFCALAAECSKFKSQIVATSQGSTRDDWYSCIRKLSKIDGVDVIALPRHIKQDMYEYEKNIGLRMTKTRLDICHLIETDPCGLLRNKFYATGTGAAVCVRELAKHPWITGVDTTMACLLASMGVEISGRFINYKPAGQLDFNVEFTPEQRRIALRNIDVLNKWAHGE